MLSKVFMIKNTVPATAHAAPETRTAAAAAGAAGTANGGENNPRTQAPQGTLEKTLEKSTAEKADDECAVLFFANLSIGRWPRASATP